MNKYKLLTPGPLTTTDTVKKEMMVDHCTWDDDYKEITQKIRRDLLALAGLSEEDYTEYSKRIIEISSCFRRNIYRSIDAGKWYFWC